LNVTYLTHFIVLGWLRKSNLHWQDKHLRNISCWRCEKNQG